MIEDEKLTLAQKYIILYIGIQKYLHKVNIQEIEKILPLVQLNENENCGYTILYKNLLLSIVSSNEMIFIDEKISNIQEEPYAHEDKIKSNFYKLKEVYDDTNILLIVISGQLLELAYAIEDSNYEEEVRGVMDYLSEKGVLYSTILFKEDRKVLKEHIISLFGMGNRQNSFVL